MLKYFSTDPQHGQHEWYHDSIFFQHFCQASALTHKTACFVVYGHSLLASHRLTGGTKLQAVAALARDAILCSHITSHDILSPYGQALDTFPTGVAALTPSELDPFSTALFNEGDGPLLTASGYPLFHNIVWSTFISPLS